jgi:hypothetical protein
MKEQFQRGDPDVFNLAWLDDEEHSDVRCFQIVKTRFARIGCGR